MKKGTAAIVIIVVALLAGGGAFWFAQNRDDSNNRDESITQTDNDTDSTSQTQQESEDESQTPDTSDQAATASVTIDNMAFSPATITVKKGTKVTWTNNDSMAHTVTKDGNDGPNSDLIQPGKTFSFTFDTVGTFKYHCIPHPQMTGTITVTE